MNKYLRYQIVIGIMFVCTVIAIRPVTLNFIKENAFQKSISTPQENKMLHLTVGLKPAVAETNSDVSIAINKPILSQKGSDSTAFNAKSIIIGIVITWGIGLIPPIIIRFKVYKKPFSKRKATWIAIGMGLCHYLLLILLLGYLKTGVAPSTVPLVFVFFAARFIMQIK